MDGNRLYYSAHLVLILCPLLWHWQVILRGDLFRNLNVTVRETAFSSSRFSLPLFLPPRQVRLQKSSLYTDLKILKLVTAHLCANLRLSFPREIFFYKMARTA